MVSGLVLAGFCEPPPRSSTIRLARPDGRLHLSDSVQASARFAAYASNLRYVWWPTSVDRSCMLAITSGFAIRLKPMARNATHCLSVSYVLILGNGKSFRKSVLACRAILDISCFA